MFQLETTPPWATLIAEASYSNTGRGITFDTTACLKSLLCVALGAFPVTMIVNEYAPAPAVPINKPLEDKAIPDGRVPDCNAKDNAFVAASWTEYVDPINTSVNAPAGVVHTGNGTVVNVNARLVTTAEEVVLIARTVKPYIAKAIGVPDNSPAVLIETPAGSAPDMTVKPVALAFVATRLEEYVTPWLVFERDDGVVHVGAFAMIQVNVRSEVAIREVPTVLIVKL